jgi:Tol biopolymer transport system component
MQQVPAKGIIPRAKLFGNPTRALCQISPDGRWLSWVAPKDGVLNIWVAPAGDIGAARVITDDRKRGIRMYAWVPDGAHLLYMQDEGGTEDWHVYAVEIDSRAVRDLTPFEGVNAHVDKVSLDEPGVVAVAINNRDKAWHDLYQLSLSTGQKTLVRKNTDRVSAWVFDNKAGLRMATRSADNGDAAEAD